MEIVIQDESNRDVKENGCKIFPVAFNESGEGLPYAPEDWPKPGDKWIWKVGKRTTGKGIFHLDRYLYPPSRLGKGKCFRGKLPFQQYIQATYPDADVDAILASFTWKIPVDENCVSKSCKDVSKQIIVVPEDVTEHSEPDSQPVGEVCRAKNTLCSSLSAAHTYGLKPMACDICCSEPGFCRDCCCILCCRHVSNSYGGYSFIRCKAAMGDSTICAHIAHIDCALRCYMAGTIGGTIGLDAEYYCRRCDNITDLIPHVAKLLMTCQSIESLEDIEKVLKVGSWALRGSQKTSAKNLLDRIEVVMAKLKDGACLVDIWEKEDICSDTSGKLVEIDEMECENYQESTALGAGSPQVFSGTFDLRIESIKLEDEIDKTLDAFRKAQRSEYRIADDALHAQKNCILDLYRQLEQERLELKTPSEAKLEAAVREREDQIQREVKKLWDMKQVAKGFGMTSKDVLEEHFGLKIDQ